MSYYVAGATVASAVIGGIGASKAKKAQKKAAAQAADAQKYAADQEAGITRAVYNANAGTSQPTRELGGLAQQRQAYLLGLTRNLNINPAVQTGHINDDNTVSFNTPGGDIITQDQSEDLFNPAMLNGNSAAIAYGPPSINGNQTPYTSVNPATGQPIGSGGIPVTGNPMDKNAKVITNNNNPNSIYTGDDQFGSFAKPFSLQDFEADPGYEFRKQQGNEALDRVSSASGLYGSGAYAKSAIGYNQGLASQEFAAAFDRNRSQRLDQWNMLAGLTGDGQVANQSLSTQGNLAGQSIGSAAAGAGNANAANALLQGQYAANNYNSNASTIGSVITAGAEAYRDYKKPTTTNNPVVSA